MFFFCRRGRPSGLRPKWSPLPGNMRLADLQYFWYETAEKVAASERNDSVGSQRDGARALIAGHPRHTFFTRKPEAIITAHKRWLLLHIIACPASSKGECVPESVRRPQACASVQYLAVTVPRRPSLECPMSHRIYAIPCGFVRATVSAYDARNIKTLLLQVGG